jgi:hypothetical protein
MKTRRVGAQSLQIESIGHSNFLVQRVLSESRLRPGIKTGASYFRIML